MSVCPSCVISLASLLELLTVVLRIPLRSCAAIIIMADFSNLVGVWRCAFKHRFLPEGFGKFIFFRFPILEVLLTLHSLQQFRICFPCHLDGFGEVFFCSSRKLLYTRASRPKKITRAGRCIVFFSPAQQRAGDAADLRNLRTQCQLASLAECS